MSASFDFHTMSLSLDMTLRDYQQAIGWGDEFPRSSTLGLHISEISAGDRSKFLSFRHEHAHLTSVLASGLADLYGMFSDYLHVMMLAVVMKRFFGERLTVPIHPAGALLADPGDIAARRAWDQVNRLRAGLFGFGTNDPLTAATDVGIQEEFWARHRAAPFQPIIDRYYGLQRRLAEGQPAGTPALPRVRLDAGVRRLSARSVLETYALSVELMATHLRSTTSSFTRYSGATARQPGPFYTVALEYLLETLGKPLDGYLTNEPAYTQPYNEVAAIAFAAMQVPVRQNLEGDVFVAGDLRTLSVAHRFAALVDGLRDGEVPRLPNIGRSRPEDNAQLLAWLAACHAHLGDEDSLRLSREAEARFVNDAELRAHQPPGQTLIELSWAARANFAAHPGEWVFDAGLWVDTYPCQARYLRTSDNEVISFGEDDGRYYADHAVPVLEALVFGDQWDSAWEKLPEVDRAGRHDMALDVAILSMLTFGVLRAPVDEPDDDWEAAGEAMSAYGIAMNRIGRHEAAAHYLTAAVSCFKHGGDLHRAALSLNNLSIPLLHLTRFDEAAELLHEAVATLHDFGDTEAEALSSSSLGQALNQLGRREAAVTTLTRSAELFDSLGNLRRRASTLLQVGNVLLDLGRKPEAAAAYKTALDLAREVDDLRLATAAEHNLDVARSSSLRNLFRR